MYTRIMYTLDMEYEWDEAKRLQNIAKHGFDFIHADELLLNPHILIPARQHENERRFLAIGKIQGHFAAIVFTKRGKKYRIISLRKARYEEREKYQTLYS
jgi:uncharacterized DUF497 family protein